jgi:heterodisulfide reductase subunit A
VVKGADTLLGRPNRWRSGRHGGAGHRRASQDGAEELAQTLHVSYDPYKFFAEAHPKLRPVETNTAGIFLAGACQAPRDIPETVAQASGAAAKVAACSAQDELTREPIIAVVEPPTRPRFSNCVGCFLCQSRLPLPGHRGGDQEPQRHVLKVVAKVNPGLCQGCGTCVSTCRTKAIDLQGFSNEQIFAELMSI